MSLRLVYRMQRSIKLGALGMSITSCNVAKTNKVTNVQFLIQDKIKELIKCRTIVKSRTRIINIVVIKASNVFIL